MEVFNIIAGIASILGLLISIFVANKVKNINNSNNIDMQGDNNKAVNQSNKAGDNNATL